MKINKLILSLSLFLIITSNLISGNKRFDFQDILKFNAIENETISDDGEWISYTAVPDWGDPEAFIKSTTDTVLLKIERGTNTKIASNSNWAASIVKAPFLDLLNFKEDEDKTANSIAIVKIPTGETTTIKHVNSFEFSNDSKWLVWFNSKKNDVKPEKKKKKVGHELIIRHLNSGTMIKVDNITEYHLDSNSTYLIYTVSSPDGESDGIYYRMLNSEFCPEYPIQKEKNTSFSNIKWNSSTGSLAFISSGLNDDGEPWKGSLWTWNASNKLLNSALAKDNVEKDWYIPENNSLKWTEDGKRLFFGIKPEAERYDDKDDKVKINKDNLYNLDTILSRTALRLWHWQDPRIMTNQVNTWKRTKNISYDAIYLIDSSKYVRLGGPDLPQVVFTENKDYALGFDDTPYLRELTWNGWYRDVWLVDLKTGKRKKILTKQEHSAVLSPLGKFVAYFKDKEWYLLDIAKDSTINLSQKIDVPLWDVESDIPADPGPYGLGLWHEGDKAVYIYDQYDIWRFNTYDEGFANMTVGYGFDHKVEYRFVFLDTDRKFAKDRDTLFLYGFDTKNKNRSFHMLETWVMGAKSLYDQDNFFTFIKKARKRSRIIYSIESYRLFPDISFTDPFFEFNRKLTDFNKQLDDYNWGNAGLVSWKNSRGEELQGIVIKPDDYTPKKKYPVLIYFYERFSDRYHSFTMPRINHRPCYPQYASDGYIVFMPDIKYIDGNPGFDATDALVRGAQMLIDSGWADPNAIGIQGHSWGGYETAFIITQTNMFKAACAGAPVANMTSAYSGIRHESGLARQFQYEKYQSRIGGNLWDSLDNYLRNSPVFNAEKIETPLLMMFGDADEAVPWEQGIELYLAMRRLNKECLFLQYENEMHHPRKMQNKLDYAMKMKEFYDVYLKGKEKPEWMTKGIPYKGK